MNRNNCEIDKKTSAGDPVGVQDAKIGGTLIGKAGTPRSYLFQTPTTCLRRNRRHLVPTPNVTLEPMLMKNRVIEVSDFVQPSQTSPSVVCISPVPPGTTTVRRSGRTFVPPKRLDLSVSQGHVSLKGIIIL